ncbi:MAG: hypothetical protein ACRDV3_08325 [Acidothermaceae bacterium]
MNLHAIPKPVYATSAVVVALAAVFAGAFLLGRQSAPARTGTWIQGNAVGYDEGVSTGRALQVGAALPADTKDVATKAFQAGYRAGLVDSFGSYDGGWNLSQPYVVVIEKGVDDAPYRIDQRELLQPGVTYQLCKNGTAVCPS